MPLEYLSQKWITTSEGNEHFIASVAQDMEQVLMYLVCSCLHSPINVITLFFCYFYIYLRVKVLILPVLVSLDVTCLAYCKLGFSPLRIEYIEPAYWSYKILLYPSNISFCCLCLIKHFGLMYSVHPSLNRCKFSFSRILDNYLLFYSLFCLFDLCLMLWLVYDTEMSEPHTIFMFIN